MISNITFNRFRQTVVFVQVSMLALTFCVVIIYGIKRVASKSLPDNIAVIPTQIQKNLRDHSSEVQKLLKKAYQIKKLVSGTFFVFTHAQSHEWTLVNDFLRGLHKQSKPCKELYISQERFDVPPSELFTNYVNDHNYRGKILSVDGYMWNTNNGESAIHYLTKNGNVSPPSFTFVHEELSKFYDYKAPLETIELATQVLALAARKQKESAVGALYVIMIEQDRSCYYRAHAFGVPCKCFGDDKKILNELQNDKQKWCWNPLTWLRGGLLPTPQYRIMLDPKENIRSVRLDNLSAKTKLNYQTELQKLIDRAHALKK